MSERCERLAFAALLALQLVPVFAFDVFATQDGATHLFNAFVLSEYAEPARGLFREVFTLSREPNPNWTAQLALAALLRMAKPDLAEKFLVASIVLGLPLAMRSLLRALGHARPWLALAVVPLAHGFALGMGLYNFCLSLALYSWLVGLYLRARWVAFAAGAVLIYFTHVVGTFALALTLAALELSSVLASPRAWRDHAVRLGRAFAACLPCAALALWFVGSEGGAGSLALALDPHAIVDRLRLVATLAYFVAWGEHGVFPLALAAFAIGWLARGVAAPADARTRGLAAAAFALFALALVAPAKALAGEMLAPRLALFPLLLAVAWVGARTPSGVAIASAPGIALGAAAALASALALADQRGLSTSLRAYHACDAQIPENAILLPLTFEPTGRFEGVGSEYARLDPHVHAGARSAIRRDAVNLDNHTAENGNHPLVWREGFVPARTIGCVECMPPDGLDLDAYPRPIDAVLAWKAPPDIAGALGEDLARDYAVACGEAPGAPVRLYLRRER